MLRMFEDMNKMPDSAWLMEYVLKICDESQNILPTDKTDNIKKFFTFSIFKTVCHSNCIDLDMFTYSFIVKWN